MIGRRYPPLPEVPRTRKCLYLECKAPMLRWSHCLFTTKIVRWQLVELENVFVLVSCWKFFAFFFRWSGKPPRQAFENQINYVRVIGSPKDRGVWNTESPTPPNRLPYSHPSRICSIKVRHNDVIITRCVLPLSSSKILRFNFVESSSPKGCVCLLPVTKLFEPPDFSHFLKVSSQSGKQLSNWQIHVHNGNTNKVYQL